MVTKWYQDRAELLVKEYGLSDPVLPYVPIIGGVFACKLLYDLARVISSRYFKCYLSLSKNQRVEWCNRAMSTAHAVFITVLSLYFVFWSDLFLGSQQPGPVTLRSSPLSTFALGVSVGYFVADIGMIFWFYPGLGGLEYVIHHLLAIVSLSYTMLSREAQIYSFMVLISETTTPAINLRWYLDTAGLKRSKAYIINGILIFLSWLFARVILFVFLYIHVYINYDLVTQLKPLGIVLVLGVPFVLGVMNLMWFIKIFKGLKKTLAKVE